jgi:hypothetical protein
VQLSGANATLLERLEPLALSTEVSSGLKFRVSGPERSLFFVFSDLCFSSFRVFRTCAFQAFVFFEAKKEREAPAQRTPANRLPHRSPTLGLIGLVGRVGLVGKIKDSANP